MGFPFSSGDVLTAADMNAIGEWITFTPSWSNLTVGNATQDASYCVVNNLIVVQFSITLGSTSAMGSTPVFTLPVNSAGVSSYQAMGVVSFHDSGSYVHSGVMQYLSSQLAMPRRQAVVGSNVVTSSPSSTGS